LPTGPANLNPIRTTGDVLWFVCEYERGKREAAVDNLRQQAEQHGLRFARRRVRTISNRLLRTAGFQLPFMGPRYRA
jgi:hypothetical protein